MYNKLIILCLLDCKPHTMFNSIMRDRPDESPIRHKDATNRQFL